MKKILTVLLFALVLTGCGSESENKSETTPVEQNTPVQENTENKEVTDATEPKGYVFEYNGVKIGMDMEAAPIIAALGEPSSYFEAPSCAFEGLDKPTITVVLKLILMNRMEKIISLACSFVMTS